MTQLELGTKVEQEHESTYNWLIDYVMEHSEMPELEEFAQHIAEDHLKENPKYYTVLKNAGL